MNLSLEAAQRLAIVNTRLILRHSRQIHNTGRNFKAIERLGYDQKTFDGGLEKALVLIEAGSYREALLPLADAYDVLKAHKAKPRYLQRSLAEHSLYIDQLSKGSINTDLAIATWYREAQQWRAESAIGTPFINPVLLPHPLMLLIIVPAILLGFGIPLYHLGFSAFPLVLLCFLAGFAAMGVSGFMKTGMTRSAVWIVVIGTLVYLRAEQVISMDYVAAFAMGTVVGLVTVLMFAYVTVVKMASQYSLMSCIWVRRLGKKNYEIIVEDDHHQTVSKENVKRISPFFDQLLGIFLGMSLTDGMLYNDDGSDDTWFQVYPRLTTYRMVKLKYTVPDEWSVAYNTTPGMEHIDLERFFSTMRPEAIPTSAISNPHQPSTTN